MIMYHGLYVDDFITLLNMSNVPYILDMSHVLYLDMSYVLYLDMSNVLYLDKSHVLYLCITVYM